MLKKKAFFQKYYSKNAIFVFHVLVFQLSFKVLLTMLTESWIETDF